MILNIKKSCIEANVYKINVTKIVDTVQTVNPNPEEKSKTIWIHANQKINFKGRTTIDYKRIPCGSNASQSQIIIPQSICMQCKTLSPDTKN